MKNPVYLIIIAFIAVSLTILGILYKLASPDLISAILALIIVGYTAFMFLFLKRNPKTLRISLLGFPNSGKTVFLTVLFDQINSRRLNGIFFSPWGRETNEKYQEDLLTIKNGAWLQCTSADSVFPYLIKASEKGILGRRYKIEVADYAGEYTKEFDIRSEKWLHRTEYFNYVTQSDAVFLSIDCSLLKTAKHQNKDIIEMQTMENAFIVALQMLIEEKRVKVGKKLKTPLAIVFMKYDLILEKPENLELYVSRLTDFCKKRCKNFQIFAVSSVGSIKKDGSPPKEIKPIGIIQPLIWTFKRLKS